MISVENAKKLIRKNTKRLSIEKKNLLQAIGDVAAEDMRAPRDLPLFDNSAMDGYVFNALDVKKASQKNPVFLKIQGVIRAGDTKKRVLKKGGVYKIMTGAMTPGGADTVCIQEKAVVKNRHIIFHHPHARGQHIRKKGEEIRKRQKIKLKNSWINPGTIGFLASLGIDKIKVFQKPRISLITTGSELVEPGRKLPKGCIYDSNSWMLQAALTQMGLKPWIQARVKDTKRSLKRKLHKAFCQSDVVILTGGVSVGEYDYVKSILQDLGVKEIFWKVSQKPGKPLFFGITRDTLVFGLPGNPASVFICFYEYVYSTLLHMMACPEPDLIEMETMLRQSVKSNPAKHLFLKGRIGSNANGKSVEVLKKQGSHMLSSLCQTDVLINFPPQGNNFQPGDKVIAHLLPFAMKRGGL